MNFHLDEAVEVLTRTPGTLESLLSGLPEGWITCNEGEGTWNVSQVVNHLIDAERQNWMPRVEWLLVHGEDQPFPDFDRFAHLHDPPEGTLEQRLALFHTLRTESLARLKNLVDPDRHLECRGQHPAFGSVKLRELLSTWVVHDFTHMTQIIRVMAGRYREDVGPWIAYLRILRQ